MDEEFDDIDGYDFDDEDEKVVTEAGETEKGRSQQLVVHWRVLSMNFQ
ncbi:MAG: hypothetical protein Ct9H300mP22_1190 [Gammaproteobacteria bacterium]|nr:MAG: hypothetical protein Ct9H300mP22_1190 [Gammaproteobacteria bacterium]